MFGFGWRIRLSDSVKELRSFLKNLKSILTTWSGLDLMDFNNKK